MWLWHHCRFQSTIQSLILCAFLCSSADSREAILQKVPGLNDIKTVQIAAGAEHSAVVTGKNIFSFLNPYLFFTLC